MTMWDDGLIVVYIDEDTGKMYRVDATDKLIEGVGVLWGKRRALRRAAQANEMREIPTCRFAIQHKGLWRWQVICLQNKLIPIKEKT